MFLLYTQLILSRSPIILIPGLYGSNLKATYEKGFAKHWYCSSKLNQDLVWVNLKYIIPPLYNCLFEMIKAHYDDETKQITSQPGLKMEVIDFGGEEGIGYIDKDGLFGHNFLESFGPMLEFFKSKGYTVKKDLFGAPYDWTLALAGIEHTFYPQLKNLIEHAYDLNNGEKVTLLGFSCGGFCIQRFLTTFVNQEWKDKYIKKILLLAPAFGGSVETLNVAWDRNFPILPFLHNDIITKAAERAPCNHVLFPNHGIWGDYPIIQGPNGEKFTAKDVPKFLYDHQKIDDISIKILMKNIPIIHEIPKEVGVPVYLLYNSGLPTEYSMKFTNGYNEEPEFDYKEGDGTVPSVGAEWACNNWNSKNSIICHDLKNDNEKFVHSKLGYNPYVLDLLFKATLDDDWINIKKSKFIYSPYVEINNDNKTFQIKNNIRKYSEKIIN